MLCSTIKCPDHQSRGFKEPIVDRLASSLRMAIILRGHSKVDMTFRFLIIWVVIVICWGAYSLLYDILIPHESSLQRNDI
jgi:hypothetical protein